ncbi:hypothetical protein HK097_002759 [Rhizophlyctis rosea]|uniref:Uncharacterized protein n=1 Tax=Rhizophlyctis rosea TaxID=64517 RepID=A0AAD5S422_9FUNG|nr:hypothetical protein HK097_002759 [Rhizophlyctis rosea]
MTVTEFTALLYWLSCQIKKNLMKTTRAFRTIANHPHCRARYLRYRFGSRAAIISALYICPNLLSVDQTVYPDAPAKKVLTLLLQAGAALPRAIIQNVVKYSKETPQTIPKYPDDFVTALLSLGHETYGNNLELSSDDHRQFCHLVWNIRKGTLETESLTVTQRLQREEEDFKTLHTLIHVHGYVPAIDSGIDGILASTSNQKLFALFLDLGKSGYPCQHIIHMTNHQTMFTKLWTCKSENPLTELQYLLDRGFTMWVLGRIDTMTVAEKTEWAESFQTGLDMIGKCQ